MALAALLTLALKPGLMRRIGKTPPAGKPPPVPGRELASVEHDRSDLHLRGADLNAPPGELRVDRVVVAIDPDERLRRNPDDLAAVDVGHPRRERPHSL